MLMLAFGLLVAACGGSDEPAGTTASTTVAAEAGTTASSGATTLATSTTKESSSSTEGGSSSSLRDLRDSLDVESIVLQPAAEGGPHPTLGWDPVDGAATYWLVLRDSSGRVYWAWTGAETSVRVGGGDSPELNQTAALHEPMTWAVAAIDGSGTLIAFSDTATVSP